MLQKFELSREDSCTQSIEFEDEICDTLLAQTPVANIVSEYFPVHGTGLNWFCVLLIFWMLIKFIMSANYKSISVRVLTDATRILFPDITQVTPGLDLLSVGGIIVKSEKTLDPAQNQPFESLGIVPLPSAVDNVKKILLQVQRGTPVCISGPIGVGKSSLLRFTASICGRNNFPDIISVQMSDQIDSRLLLGSYHSTDLPGQFVWKPGCLTKAILNGHWIILEDLDSAPIDVATMLDAIADTRQITVPGYGQITQFHTNFRLFSTVRTTTSGSSRRDIDKHCKTWVNLSVKGLAPEELTIVIRELFPVLNPIAERIVEIFLSVKNASLVSKRSVSVR